MTKGMAQEGKELKSLKKFLQKLRPLLINPSLRCLRIHDRIGIINRNTNFYNVIMSRKIDLYQCLLYCNCVILQLQVNQIELQHTQTSVLICTLITLILYYTGSAKWCTTHVDSTVKTILSYYCCDNTREVRAPNDGRYACFL
jgi:hypothetical protein